MLARVGPVTLPSRAYGPEPLTWAERSRPSVWAWVQWPDRPAERVEASALGWNDRCVVVEFHGAHGTVQTTVWRQAVTVRTERADAVPRP